MEWFYLEKQENSKLPEWKRSFAINDDGVVFVPGALAGISENEVHLCSHFDATPSVENKNHRYFPSKWLAKEFPKSSQLCALIEQEAERISEKS